MAPFWLDRTGRIDHVDRRGRTLKLFSGGRFCGRLRLVIVRLLSALCSLCRSVQRGAVVNVRSPTAPFTIVVIYSCPGELVEDIEGVALESLRFRYEIFRTMAVGLLAKNLIVCTFVTLEWKAQTRCAAENNCSHIGSCSFRPLELGMNLIHFHLSFALCLGTKQHEHIS